MRAAGSSYPQARRSSSRRGARRRRPRSSPRTPSSRRRWRATYEGEVDDASLRRVLATAVVIPRTKWVSELGSPVRLRARGLSQVEQRRDELSRDRDPEGVVLRPARRGDEREPALPSIAPREGRAAPCTGDGVHRRAPRRVDHGRGDREGGSRVSERGPPDLPGGARDRPRELCPRAPPGRGGRPPPRGPAERRRGRHAGRVRRGRGVLERIPRAVRRAAVDVSRRSLGSRSRS